MSRAVCSLSCYYVSELFDPFFVCLTRSFFFTGLRAVFILRLLTTNTGHESVTELVSHALCSLSPCYVSECFALFVVCFLR